jgi:Esterase PHB depolymerase
VKRRVGRRALVVAALSIAYGAIAGESPAPAAAPATGLQRDVVFTDYSPLSATVEVAHRLLSPLANVEIARLSSRPGQALRPQAIDLTQEAFTVYVPPNAPPQGYGLLVFIPPWQKAFLPGGWAAVLDQHGVIFVSASKSGNEEKILDRRIPLALLGAYNVMQRYRVDKERVYIGGLSGGSRVAMRAALGYPDLFHGALLNAGSDPIGDDQALIPPDDLFQRFQSSSRLAYVTGSYDSWNIEHDVGSRNSMEEWCVFGASVDTMQNAGHEIAAPFYLSRALTALDKGPALRTDRLAACRAHIAKELAAKLQHVNELLDRGKSHDAWLALAKIDARYGGLALPQSIEIEQRIGSQR